jgi:hypothetical protein
VHLISGTRETKCDYYKESQCDVQYTSNDYIIVRT